MENTIKEKISYSYARLSLIDIFFIVAFFAIMGGLVYILRDTITEAVDAFARIIVAVIGAGSALLLAVINHTLEIRREREQRAAMVAQEQEKRENLATKERESREDIAKNEREHQKYLAKQEAYKNLLGTVQRFVRRIEGQGASYDALTEAHLESWAFGDETVMMATNKYMADQNRDALVNLLKAIRNSLGQPVLGEDFYNTFNFDLLFPTRPPDRI